MGMYLDESRPVTPPVRCTVRRHPDGGWTPVLHPAEKPPPEPHREAISLPDVAAAIRWARNHYGATVVTVADVDSGSRPA